MEYWTDLYEELAGRIRGKLPKIVHTDLWHEQVSYLTEELPFPAPAVFLSFATISTDDRGLLIQDCNTQVDMYLFYETFADTYEGSGNQSSALEFLQQLTKLHALFHGKTGQTYSSMRRTGMQREDSGGAGNLYRITFECLVTDYSAQNLFITAEDPDREICISKGENTTGLKEPPLFDMRE